jgi:ferredoxin
MWAALLLISAPRALQSAAWSKTVAERVYLPMAAWARDHTGPDDIVETSDIGYVGYFSGRTILDALPARAPSPTERELTDLKLQAACEHMGRRLDHDAAVNALRHWIEHPRWDDVAKRCLSCTNCTLVCPTCFCCTVSDSNALSGGAIARTRVWESCFSHQFSYVTTGPVRNTIRGRYRHWLRHKLCTWWDQFGTSGCVGCGRCITWCPVGIDLTEEAAAVASRHAFDAPDPHPSPRAAPAAP